MKAHIIAIGDEILYGETTDTNSGFIAREFTKTGIQVQEIQIVSDSEDAILQALNKSQKEAKIILTTGGLGPTKDDITKHTIAKFFKQKLILDTETLKHVEYLFTQIIKRPMNDLNHAQAMIPEKTIALKNEIGTAPGMWTEYQGKIYINLPGVPMEMKKLVQSQVIPKIKENFRLPIILQRHILVVGVPESELAILLKNWENQVNSNQMEFAYLPTGKRVKIRLTAKGNDEAKLNQKLKDSISQLQEILGKNILSIKGENIEKLLGIELKQQNLTISTVESCTGGAIAKRITSVSGSSKYYKGSIISYATEIKQKILEIDDEIIKNYSVVSEEIAIKMATMGNLKLNTDICIATTGVAGPNLGEDQKKVGTVWLAISYKNQTMTQKYFYPKLERNDWIDFVSRLAIDNMYKLIINKKEK